mmetsp:Transcript_3528/g.6792  ORF Transcript_3528/g.6792 Transcript_3528/m.6792 type:complete len:317 (-) Transcript_3528:232-1182(-)
MTDLGDDHLEARGGNARELLIPSRGEWTATLTHYCCHAARVVLLLSHGLSVIVTSTSLKHLEEAHWWVLFSPVWVGYALCAVLVPASCCASLPYLQLCWLERNPRAGVGDNNPSALTEIIPEILLSVFGFFFLLLTFIGEFKLCGYLNAARLSKAYSLAAPAWLLCISALLAICQGILFTHNSPLFIFGGSGLFLTMVIFAATRGGSAESQALAIVPAAVAVFGLFLAMLARLRRHFHLLNREERVLRMSEVGSLATLSIALVLSAYKVAHSNLPEAETEVAVAGGSLCVVAVLRVRLCCWEVWSQPLDERRFTEV